MNLDKWTHLFDIIWKIHNSLASDGHFPFEIKLKMDCIYILTEGKGSLTLLVTLCCLTSASFSFVFILGRTRDPCRESPSRVPCKEAVCVSWSPQHKQVKFCMRCGGGPCGFWSWTPSVQIGAPAVWPWEGHLPFLCLRFLICILTRNCWR